MRLSGWTVATLTMLAGALAWLVVADEKPFLVAILFGAVAAAVLHEVGHVVGAVLVGVEVDVVRITPVGGAVSYLGEPDVDQRAAVSIAGPAASAVGMLAGLALPLLDGAPEHAVTGLAAVSFWQVVANLVPIGTTDGAELLRALRRRGASRSRPSGDPGATPPPWPPAGPPA